MERVRRILGRYWIWLDLVAVVAVSFLVYWFSPDSRVQVLEASGNYIFTDQQVYKMAGVSPATRLWLVPSEWMDKNLRQNPLVESASVSKSGNKLSFQIKEAFVVGYVVEGGTNYLLKSDGSLVELEPAYVKSIIHFPLLSDFSHEQLREIAKQFESAKKYVTKGTIAQIAEIVPYKSSYDDNMLRMTMNDGNVVFSSMKDLPMMAYYEDMLEQLQGQSVCLLLDKDNSAINKVACDYLNMSQDERIAYWEAIKAQQEAAQHQAEEEQRQAEAEEAARKAEEARKQQEEAAKTEEGPVQDTSFEPEGV